MRTARMFGLAVLLMACYWVAPPHARAQGAAPQAEALVTVSGHVLPALAAATPLPHAQANQKSFGFEAPITLTIVLRRTDPGGFDEYLKDVYTPASPQFRKFLTPEQITTRFGPTRSDFDAVRAYFARLGFTEVDAPPNRLTLTVTGSRAAVQAALGVTLGDYRLGTREFYANATEPTLPTSIAAKVQSIGGLSDLAQVSRVPSALKNLYDWGNGCDIPIVCGAAAETGKAGYNFFCFTPVVGQLTWLGTLIIAVIERIFTGAWKFNPCPPLPKARVLDSPDPDGKGFLVKAGGGGGGLPNFHDGTGQVVGLVEYDTFLMSDVADYFALLRAPASIVNQITTIPVNGGASAGANQSEVLLDIDTVLVIAPAAQVRVYTAPNSGSGGSYQAIVNRMINDHVTVISNSWSYCEDQTTLADVQGIDAVFAAAAASGITILNGSGDTGSTCLDGAANTVGVPASSPNATAVGGTSLVTGPGNVYVSETWWDGTNLVPPTGQGGFGVSKFFSRPAYQNGLTSAANRSIPDLAVNADPRHGMVICQASNGGCPNNLLYGGTSFAAPQMAGYIALLNQARGANMGFLNPVLYALANTTAFHTPASMGSDFAHVGLGSPNFGMLQAHLNSVTPGPVDPVMSGLRAIGNASWVNPPVQAPFAADGATPVKVVVQLRDAQGYIVAGKTVTLAANPGSHAVISPLSGVTTLGNGTVVFDVTNTHFEVVTLTATDTTDGIVVEQTDTMNFVAPPADSGGIQANPASVPPNGSSTATITVTLQRGGSPSPGKVVSLAQGSGHSVIAGPVPAVTDANGQVQFTVKNGVSEQVVYTAIDVTDGNLPVPGSATVDFTGTATSCVAPPPTAAAGFAITAFETGFFAENFNFGNVNWGGCPGVSNPTFSTNNSLYVTNFRTGDLFSLPLTGGAVSDTNKVSNLGQTLGQPTFGKDGRLYATHGSTGGNFTTGNIVEIDPLTGVQLRVVAANLTCPNGLAVDPLSGDLFFDDSCFGVGSDNPSLWRIHDPAGAATLTVYATLPRTPNGWIAFSPDGTLYVVTGYNDAQPQVLKISGTDKPSPPTITPLPGVFSNFWVAVAQALPNGAAKSLILLESGTLELVDITTATPTKTPLATGSIGSGTIGPDGCLYTSGSDTVYKITPAAGACGFVPTNPAPALKLSPSVVSPNPAQGTSQSFTAQILNASVPAGTPILFQIKGANAQLKQATTNGSGQATISYVGDFVGTDSVTAQTTIASTALGSNTATVTWSAGKHRTFVTLNSGASGATVGQPVTVQASVTDVSVEPQVGVAGVSVHFAVGAGSCDGITNANGVASCVLTLPTPGVMTLTVTFAGNGQFLASSATEQFNVVTAGAVGLPPGPPVVGTATGVPGGIALTFSPPADDGGSAIASYLVQCTRVGGGVSAFATGVTSPITVVGLAPGTSYTCTVTASNALGPGPASSPSNAASPLAIGSPAQIPTLGETALALLASLVLLLGLATARERERTSRRVPRSER